MKKNLLTALAVLTFGIGVAQTPTLVKTCYRGAFAPSPAPMWTNGWTNWDPQNQVYPAPNTTITTNITASTTWTTGQVVLISAQCFVKNNAVLTIQPGVIVLGDKAVVGACLLIETGSQLIANGTATNPIVFTSNQAAGARGLGDWGGVILCGLATNNSPAGTGTLTNPAGTNYIEGFPVSPDVLYGGANDNDNSGSLKYIRIEFGGYVYQPNKEINGLTMGAVGRGTTIDYVQCSFTNDDSFEWFGGAVNCTHLVAYRGLDDDFDTDNGFHGNVQFCLGVRDPNISDNPAVSTSEGFESDNDPNGTVSTPITTAIFSNITEIGPQRGVPSATCASGFRRGARIRRNSQLKIVNSIIMDHKTRGVYIDGALCEGNANANTIVFKNNIVAGYGERCMETGTFGILVNPNLWVRTTNPNDTLLSTAGILTTPYSYTAPDYRPAAGSLAMAGASFTDPAISAATGTIASTNAVAGIPTTVCISNGTAVVAPAYFTASSTVTPNYCSLGWNATAGVVISATNVPNPSFTINTVGSFTINMVVTDANGTQTIVSTITTNTCVGASVKGNSGLTGNISIFPNPASDFATLKITNQNATLINVMLTDISGKQLLNSAPDQVLNAGENTINISTKELSNGIYFVTLKTDTGKETIKLIVSH